PRGMKEVAELCWQKAHYAADQIARIPGISLRFPGPFFKEFVVELPRPAEELLPAFLDAGIHAGIPLARWYPELDKSLLVAVTEKRTKQEIDRLVETIQRVAST
ncbi:MAG: hypothetical protein U0T81_19935, partial [Saprospiraceae bacterium]